MGHTTRRSPSAETTAITVVFMVFSNRNVCPSLLFRSVANSNGRCHDSQVSPIFHFARRRCSSRTRLALKLASLAGAISLAISPVLAPAEKATVPAVATTTATQGEVVVDSETEAVIKGALKWMAAEQSENGSWNAGSKKVQQHPVAMTGYTLIAFMAAGQLPEEGEYAPNVTAGMQFLLDTAGPDGLFRDVSNGQYMYNHGIATIALAELYGQTRSPIIRPTLERLVQVIVRTQGKAGGWRYQPVPRDADISVTVLQVVALRAAKNAGLDVPGETIENAIAYVRSCSDEKTGGFTYTARGGGAGYARTAAAIYSLQVCGQYDDPLIKGASEYLFKSTDKSYWTYGSYYAAPAQYMIGGETWRKWYAMMKEALLTQVKRGSDGCHWDFHHSGDVGPLYSTAVYTSILAMPYHYIPLYQR